MTTNAEQLYGRGFAFPFAFDPATGAVQQSAGVVSVEDSLALILGTMLRERFMAPTIGSRIGNILFELEVPYLTTVINAYIQEATALEPRVGTILDVQVNTDPLDAHRLLIYVIYRLINSADARNLVIPLQG
jgi:phage baseplate assembly protein W